MNSDVVTMVPCWGRACGRGIGSAAALLTLACGIGTAAPAAGQAGGPLTVVSGDNLFAKAVDQVSGADTRADRWPHILPQAVTTLVPSWYNWINTGLSGGATGAAITILSAVLECPDGVTVVPLTVAGRTGWSLPDGANDVQNDPVPAGACGLKQFPPGAIVWTKTVAASVDAGVPVSTVDADDVAGSQSIGYVGSTTTVANTTGAGPFVASGAAPKQRRYGLRPVMLGTLKSPGKAVAVFGDSITELISDQRRSVWGRAWFQRAMEIDGLPSLNFAVAGSSSTLGSTNARLSAYLRYANRGVIFYCTNDFGTGGNGVGAPTCANRLRRRKTQMNAAGIAIVGAGMLLPRAWSANEFEAAADQTNFTGWGVGQSSEQLNAMLGTIFSYTIGFAGARGASPLFWVTNGKPYYATYDGVHPRAVIHAAMAKEAAADIAGEISSAE